MSDDTGVLGCMLVAAIAIIAFIVFVFIMTL